MKPLPKYKTNIKQRSDLLTLLSEACEIEHGLACSYLYAAFSLKQETSEGLTGEQLHSVRKWAAQVFFVASQEMLHLAQAWNLLTAIGGTPYYFRPNFPQNSKYYPFGIPLKLEPFGLEALKRFIYYELPADINDKQFLAANFGFQSEDQFDYKSVGQLYELILEGFLCIDEKELFIGHQDMQLGPEEVDFKEIIKVNNRASAKAAIEMITEQGEGTKRDRDDCHYGIFRQIESDFQTYLSKDPNFSPARNVISNPIVFNRGNYASEQGELIVNEATRNVADMFDDVYNLMLRALQHAFSNNKLDKTFNKELAHFAIQIMVRVIKPLGESLTKMPAFNDSYLKKAGPAFSLTRHIPFPDNNPIALILIKERTGEILERLKNLPPFAGQNEIRFHLEDILQRFIRNFHCQTAIAAEIEVQH